MTRTYRRPARGLVSRRDDFADIVQTFATRRALRLIKTRENRAALSGLL
jgi:hypothetical protein